MLIIIYISNVLYIQYIKSVNVITVIIMASVGAFLCNTTKQFARYRLLLPLSLSRAFPCAHLSIYLYSLPLLIIAFFILLKRFVTDFLSK